MPADLSNYTLQGGMLVNPAPASSLGIPDIAFQFKSRTVDTATFTIPVASADADPVFPFGSQVSIRQGGTQIFLGSVQSAPEVVISGTGEALRYKLVGPWWNLENIVYQQTWAFKTPAGVMSMEPRSHITLFQDSSGARITTGAQILDALTWAIGAGAPLQAGAILGGIEAPTRDTKDVMCAEVIKQCILWTPDVVVWFDYSTIPPTLHMQRAAALTPVTLSMADGAIADTLQITARHDLQVPSVTLKFEQTNTDDSGTWTSTSVDTYPVGRNEQTLKALVQTLELSGSHSACQKQPVVTRVIPISNGSNDSTIINWFRNREPWLANLLTSAQMEVVAGSYYAAIDPGQTYLDGTPIVTDSPTGIGELQLSDLPNELVSGSLTDWMQAAYPNLMVARVTVGVMLSFNGDLTDFTDEQQSLIKRAFNMGVSESDPNYNTLWRYVGVVATNASTRVYSIVTSFTPAEAVPTGLARALYEALGTLYYDVAFQTVEQDITRAIGLGNALNLTGSRAEYATMSSPATVSTPAAMGAPVQEINWSLASGTTTIKCGPPEHLAPQNVIEFLRGLRNTVCTDRLAERATGQASGAITVGGTGWTPSSTSPNPPGGGGGAAAQATPWQMLSNANGGDPNVLCNPYSHLFKAVMDGTTETIANIGTAFVPGIGDYAFLKLSQDASVALTTIEFKIGAWPGAFFTTDTTGSPFVNAIYVPLAKFVDATDPTPGMLLTIGAGANARQLKAIQLCNQHQLLTLRAYPGGLAGWTVEEWAGIA